MSEDSDAITDEGASYASTFQSERAAKLAGCTGTRISARFALTAAHCLGNGMQAEVGNAIEFYRFGAFSPSGDARIEQRFARSGISVDSCYQDHDNCYDGDRLADIALLRLSADDEADLEGPHTTLAWVYPGGNVAGKAVGAGRHNGIANPNQSLRQANGELDSSSDADGMFETDESETDDGDSGGPFYVGSKLVGVLSGTWDYAPDTYGLYTSVPYYIHWLLTTSGYQWRGQPPQPNTAFIGDVIELSDNSQTTCRYACEKTTACEAYSWNAGSNMCWLYKNVAPATTAAGWTGGLKAGRAGTSGDAVGYVRSDGIHSVVHVGATGRVEELALVGGDWVAYPIHGSAPLAASRLTAIERADGTNAVYYRSTSNHIIELALESDGWHAYNLSTSTGAMAAAGAPAAYVKGDGVTAVVYRATNGHIIELRLGTRGWIDRDLSIASGSSSVVASSDPSVSVRTGGLSSVVFRAGSHIWEYYQGVGGTWAWGVPSQLTSAPTNPTPPPAAASRPVGYSHRGGIHAIVYRSTSDEIIELWLSGSQWVWGVLASGAKGDPVAYTRTDGKEAILFRNANGHIMQTANGSGGWATQNLTTLTGANAATSDPYVYHRADGYNSILFEAGTRVNELYWKRGTAGWATGDLTP